MLLGLGDGQKYANAKDEMFQLSPIREDAAFYSASTGAMQAGLISYDEFKEISTFRLKNRPLELQPTIIRVPGPVGSVSDGAAASDITVRSGERGEATSKNLDFGAAISDAGKLKMWLSCKDSDGPVFPAHVYRSACYARNAVFVAGGVAAVIGVLFLVRMIGD